MLLQKAPADDNKTQTGCKVEAISPLIHTQAALCLGPLGYTPISNVMPDTLTVAGGWPANRSLRGRPSGNRWSQLTFLVSCVTVEVVIVTVTVVPCVCASWFKYKIGCASPLSLSQLYTVIKSKTC